MDVETAALSIIKCCKPTTSQEARFSNIPLVRDSDNSVDSIQAPFSSSSVLTPSEPNRILVISLPGSSDSVNKHTVEEDPVFLTPPESRSPSHLSSEDQNLDHCCAEGMTIFEAEKGSDRKTKVRVLEAGFDDEPEAKRVRVGPGEEFEGETVPLDDTEVVQIETVQDTNVVSGNGDSTLSMPKGSLDVTGEAVTIDSAQEMGVLMKDSVALFDANNGNHELEKKRECVDIQVTGGNKPCGNSDSGWSLDIDKIPREIVRLKHIDGEKCREVKLKSDASRSQKVVDILKDAEMPKDIHIDDCLRSNGKIIQEIEEFRYTGDVNRRCERTGGTVGVSGRRRQLPPSLKGKEEELVGSSVKESGLLDLLNELKAVLEETEDDSEEVDILETAKQCGWTFPRVRWWPPDGEDWSHGLP